MLKLYDKLVNKAPILTQSIMASGACFFGDIVAQTLVPWSIHRYNYGSSKAYESPKYDFSRSVKFAAFGLLYFGNLDSRWLRYLDRVIPASSKHAVPKKLVLDQGFFTPSLNFGFLLLNSYLEFRSFSKSTEIAKSEIWPIMSKGWPFWISFMYLNFKFVPLNFRLLTIQIADIIWNSFLSWYSSQVNLKNAVKPE